MNPDTAWMKDGRCTEPDVSSHLFFSKERVEIKLAKGICQGCPVNGDCLQYALTHDGLSGVWGGYDEAERRSLRRQALARSMA